MSAESWAPLRFQQLQIRIGDRVNLNHAGAWEPNRMRQLDLAAHARPFRAAEVGQGGVQAGSGVDNRAADDFAVLHAPSDLAALVLRFLWFAGSDRTGAGSDWHAPTYAGQTAIMRVPSPAAGRLMSARRPA